MTDASQGVGQFGRCIAAHEIGGVEGKFPGGGSTAVVSFIVLHGLKARLHLWAGGGRAAPAVEAHSRGLWQLSRREIYWEVALRDARITVCNLAGESIGSARRP